MLVNTLWVQSSPKKIGGGHLHAVAYTSRKLKNAQLRYSVVEKEVLAIVRGASYFKHYLLVGLFGKL